MVISRHTRSWPRRHPPPSSPRERQTVTTSALLWYVAQILSRRRKRRIACTATPLFIPCQPSTDVSIGNAESFCAPGAHRRHQHALPPAAQPAGIKSIPAVTCAPVLPSPCTAARLPLFTPTQGHADHCPVPTAGQPRSFRSPQGPRFLRRHSPLHRSYLPLQGLHGLPQWRMLPHLPSQIHSTASVSPPRRLNSSWNRNSRTPYTSH